MSEQAPALGSNDLDSLASFLSDTPETEPNDELEANPADESTAESDTDEEANAETDDEDIDPDEPDDAKEPAPERKVKITAKAEDGTESTEEVTETELVKGYQRQADYTRKTQALATRESEAVQFLSSKHQEMRDQYLQQAEVQRTAIVGMAGIKSENEMAQLANSDPAAWVAENQRQNSIRNYLSQIDQQISGEKQQATQEAEQRQAQRKQKMFTQAWAELSKDGIDTAKLSKVYTDVSKEYGFTAQELGEVYDPRVVRAFKDAAAFRELQSQKKAVTAKVQEVTKLPSKQHNVQPARDKAIDARFKQGRAKLSDLAAYFS
jgi:hypothetical protein